MKRIIISLGIIIAVASVAGRVTYSYFSSTKTSTDNTFSAGTLEILLDPNGIVNDETTGPTLPVNLSNLVPGYDGATDGKGYYYPAVANVGTMDFKWKFAFTESDHISPNGGDLGDVLKVRIEESRENASGNPWDYPAGGSFNCQYAGIWDGSYGTSSVISIYSGKIGEYPSTFNPDLLAPNKGRCYRVSFYLDGSVGNEYQGASVKYTISADAEQIH